MKRKILTFLTLFVALFGLFGLSTSNKQVVLAAGDATTVQHDIDSIYVAGRAIMSFPVTTTSVYGNTIAWEVEAGQEVISFDEEAGWMVVDRSKVQDTTATITLTVSVTGASGTPETKSFDVVVPAGTTAARTFTIQYNLDGGLANVELPTEYKLGQATFELPTDVTKDGYTFVGWYEGTTKVEKILVGSMKDYNLIAVWSKGITSSMIEDIVAVDYTGEELTPTVTIKDGDTSLVLGTDYMVEYANNINAGTATVTVKGIGKWNGEATKEFTINKVAPTIDVTNLTTTYDGTVHSIVATSNSDGVITYTNNDQTNAGIYTVTVKVAEGTNHLAGEATATLEIEKATAEITADEEQAFDYTGSVINVVASLNHDEVELTYSNEYINAGTYTVTISAAESTNYKAASKEVTLEIRKVKETTPTLEVVAKTQVAITLNSFENASYRLNGGQWQDSPEFTGLTANTEYMVEAYVKASDTNHLDSDVASLSVTTEEKIVPTLTFDDMEKTYGDEPFTLQVTTDSDGELTYSIDGEDSIYASITNGVLTILKANPEGILVSVTQAETEIYAASGEVAVLVIKKAEAELTVDNVIVPYDGNAHSITGATVTGNGAITYSENNTLTNVGSVTVTVEAAASDNYNATSKEVTLEVTPVPLTVTPKAQNINLGATLPTWDLIKLTFTGLVNDELASEVIDGSLLQVVYKQSGVEVSNPTEVGTYEIHISGLTANNNNYSIEYEVGTLTIEDSTLTIRVDDESTLTKEYDGTSHSFTASVYDGNTKIDGIELTYLWNGTAFAGATDAGTYDVTVSFSHETYGTKSATFTFTISPREATVTANNATSAYGDSPVALTYQASDSILTADLAGFGFQAVSTVTNTSLPAEYAITVNYTENSNYNITVQSGTYTVTKRLVTIKADDKNSVYGDELVAYSYTVTSNTLVAGDEEEFGSFLTYVCSVTATSSVGTYPISITVQANDKYEVKTVDGLYTITAKDLTDETVSVQVVGNDFNLQNTATLTPTVEVTFGGAVITTYTLAYKDNDKAGTATITVTFTGNYTGTQTATFTITEFGLASIDGDALEAELASSLRGNVVAINDLPLTYGQSTITWTSDNTAVAVNPTTGKVTITRSDVEDVTVHLTATLTCGDTSADTKVFTFVVPTSATIELTDEATGIIIQKASYNSTVEVTLAEDGKYQAAVEANENTKYVQAYNIVLMKNGEAVQPEGNVTVKIPVPAGYADTEEFVIYYVDEAGTATFIECTTKDGYIIFDTNHFSVYAIGVVSTPVASNPKIVFLGNNTATDDSGDLSEINENNITSETKENFSTYIKTMTPNDKVYLGKGESGLKFGSSSAKGSLVITLKENIYVKGIVLTITEYGTDTPTITVNNIELVDNAVDFETAVNTITITTNIASKQRFYLSSIELILGEVVEKTDAEKVAADKEALTLDTPVTGNFDLPLEGANGTTISWVSDNENVIKVADGIANVTRPELGQADATVTLTATIELNGETDTKKFTITVKGYEKLATPVIEIKDKVVSWAEVPNATKYEIYCDGTKLNETTSLSYTLTGLEEGSYTITVKAIGDEALYVDSELSEGLNYIVEAGTTEPTEVTVTSTFKDMNLKVADGEPTWTTSVDATSLESANLARGVQFGTNKGEVVLTHQNTTKTITKVIIVSSTNGSGNTLSVSVGGVTTEPQTITSGTPAANSEYTFELSTYSTGDVKIIIQDTVKSVYIKSITLVYTE